MKAFLSIEMVCGHDNSKATVYAIKARANSHGTKNEVEITLQSRYRNRLLQQTKTLVF